MFVFRAKLAETSLFDQTTLTQAFRFIITFLFMWTQGENLHVNSLEFSFYVAMFSLSARLAVDELFYIVLLFDAKF